MMDGQMQGSVLKDLRKAIDGEHDAICCYEVLVNQAPDEKIKKRILEILNDEIRHYEMFSHIYFCLTGQHYSPQKQTTCPPTYKEGINHAFHDEQETVDFYHEMARKIHDPWISHAFSDAASDEQNHAVWFLYFMLIYHR